MRNTLWYLGFLSFLSLLYFVRKDTWYLVYLSYLMFFFTYNASDERVEFNEGRAARNAFLYIMVITAASLVYVSLTGNILFYQKAFAALTAGALVICVLSYKYYEWKGDRI